MGTGKFPLVVPDVDPCHRFLAAETALFPVRNSNPDRDAAGLSFRDAADLPAEIADGMIPRHLNDVFPRYRRGIPFGGVPRSGALLLLLAEP